MQTNNIIIFSRPIRSGKTTELFSFIKDKKNVTGILTPDSADGKRLLYDIAAIEYHEFEMPGNSESPAQVIGKFLFSEKAFAKAQQIIVSQKDNDFFIIDEIGKLEIMQGKGFEPALSELIRLYQTGKRQGQLVLVIRDSLLQQAVEKYSMPDAMLINELHSL